jgi:hypothetical protein
LLRCADGSCVNDSALCACAEANSTRCYDGTCRIAPQVCPPDPSQFQVNVCYRRRNGRGSIICFECSLSFLLNFLQQIITATISLPVLNETGNTSAAIDFDVPTTYDGQASLRVSAPAGAFDATSADCNMAIVLSPVADSQMVNVTAMSPGIEATVNPCGKFAEK